MMEQLLSGDADGGLDQAAPIKAARARAPAGSFLWAYVSPTRLAQIAPQFGAATPPKGNAPPAPGITLSAAAAPGAVRVLLDWPVVEAKKIGEMIAGMAARFVPPPIP
jgi:hypothetical protein